MLKYHKPTSPARRKLVLVDKKDLWKGKPVKKLVQGISQKAGRNNQGRITNRHRGGGHKRTYRIIDFKRNKQGKAEVVRIEYDPNRTAFIALIKYDDDTLSYIIAPQRIKVGDVLEAAMQDIDIKIGNAMPLAQIPVGTIVHNVELKVQKGAQIARAAGCYARIAGRDQDYTILKLNSAEQRIVHSKCKATIGAVSNPDNMNVKLGKAGRKRWMGIRPTVRGAAMNPVDHPHGGGEGKTSGGRHPVSPWGLSAKGKKTRKNKLTQKYILKQRSKQKKRS